MKFYSYALFLAVMSAVVLTSCKKETTTPPATPLTTAQLQSLSADQQITQGENDNLGKYMSSYAQDNGHGKTDGFGVWSLPAGATVTAQTVGDEWLFTVDFGTSGLLCNDGRKRKGKVFARAKGLYRTTGSTIVVTTQDYYSTVAGGSAYHKHNLRQTHTNLGRNAANHLEFSVSETDTVLTADGVTINWTSSRVNEFTGGENTIIDWTDDVYQVTGTAKSVRVGTGGYDCDWTILSPLEVHLNCRVVQSGKLSIQQVGDPDAVTIDYGSGCDLIKIVTVKYKIYSFNVNI